MGSMQTDPRASRVPRRCHFLPRVWLYLFSTQRRNRASSCSISVFEQHGLYFILRVAPSGKGDTRQDANRSIGSPRLLVWLAGSACSRAVGWMTLLLLTGRIDPSSVCCVAFARFVCFLRPPPSPAWHGQHLLVSPAEVLHSPGSMVQRCSVLHNSNIPSVHSPNCNHKIRYDTIRHHSNRVDTAVGMLYVRGCCRRGCRGCVCNLTWAWFV